VREVVNSASAAIDLNFEISLTYLAGVFGILNSLNIWLQLAKVTIWEAIEKVESYREKLSLWGRRVNSGNLAHFLLFDEITSDSVGRYLEETRVREGVITHLENLNTTTEGIIPTGSVSKILEWNPFNVSFEQISNTESAKDQILELRNNIFFYFD
jgi:hypothetical protein